MPAKIARVTAAALLLLTASVLGLNACSSQPGAVREASDVSLGRSQTHHVEVSWAPPVARADGTGIDPEDLGGYKIYYGTSPDSLDQVIDIPGGSNTKYKIDNLSPRTYYFAITAYDLTGRESAISKVVSKRVEPAERGVPKD